MTAQARRTLALLDQPSDLLLWSRGARHPMFSNATVGLRDAIDAWARETLPDLPAGLNGRLLRHTAQVLHGRPRHNTPAVQDQHYLRRDEQSSRTPVMWWPPGSRMRCGTLAPRCRCA